MHRELMNMDGFASFGGKNVGVCVEKVLACGKECFGMLTTLRGFLE